VPLRFFRAPETLVVAVAKRRDSAGRLKWPSSDCASWKGARSRRINLRRRKLRLALAPGGGARYGFALVYAGEDGNGTLLPVFPAGPPAATTEFGVSVFSSIQQIGLKLEAQKPPLDTIVRIVQCVMSLNGGFDSNA
jgi:hypothetical protein